MLAWVVFLVVLFWPLVGPLLGFPEPRYRQLTEWGYYEKKGAP